MKKFNTFVQERICIIIIFSLIIILACGIYCFPINIMNFKKFALETIFYFLFFSVPIAISKVNNYTGATEIYTRISGFSKIFIYSSYNVILVGLIAGIILLIKAFIFKNFAYASLFLPSVYGLYAAAKGVEIYEKEIQYLKKDKANSKWF